jgi:hypothetical protein
LAEFRAQVDERALSKKNSCLSGKPATSNLRR